MRLGKKSHKPTRLTAAEFKRALTDNLFYRLGQEPAKATPDDMYRSLAMTVRDQMVQRWRDTLQAQREANPKFVYYLSAEYLFGRPLTRNLLYTGMTDIAAQAVSELGFDLGQLAELDPTPTLGNGGLGRLGACFLDSMATMDIPCIGYGIRYEYGIFRQTVRDGWQMEGPDEWLLLGNPWEFRQPDEMVVVRFGGYTETHQDENGRYRVKWHPAQEILGEPYHMLVAGYQTKTVNIVRLWRCRATQEFDFQLFDIGDYTRAVQQKIDSEALSKVLYPNDNTPQGKELRLKQQYFFVACSLRDIVNRFLANNDDWDQLPDKAAIHLNDTHPAIAITELMRILVDEANLGWRRSWAITSRCFSYTIHTLLPEALEKWPLGLFGRLLPRHLDIIYEINSRMLDEVRERYPDDPDRLARMSIIEEGHEKQVRMAHLAAAGSHSINGVAELQTDLLQEQVLADFYELWPDKFSNKTNGVSPRRFVRLANPGLAALITSTIGDGWLTNLDKLNRLVPLADDPAFLRAWLQVKQENKQRLAATIRKTLGQVVDPDSLFDVMAKRIHEYKRQVLKVLHIITLYDRLKADPEVDILPRTFIFSGKAAPGHQMARLVIKLIHSVGAVVNADPDVAGRLKVVFLPNFDVSLGELIYPAADLSEQIALAGKEASGTGNMKLALNGAVTIGALVGANIEIRQRVGAENFFAFGLTAEEMQAKRETGYRPVTTYESDPALKEVVDRISAGQFSGGDGELFRPIVDELLYHDPYLHLADFASYVACQDRVDQAYRDVEAWTRKSVLNTAHCGYFSSDRSVAAYCQEIWQVVPVPVPD